MPAGDSAALRAAASRLGAVAGSLDEQACALLKGAATIGLVWAGDGAGAAERAMRASAGRLHRDQCRLGEVAGALRAYARALDEAPLPRAPSGGTGAQPDWLRPGGLVSLDLRRAAARLLTALETVAAYPPVWGGDPPRPGPVR